MLTQAVIPSDALYLFGSNLLLAQALNLVLRLHLVLKLPLWPMLDLFLASNRE
jgi:hypothetical protein